MEEVGQVLADQCQGMPLHLAILQGHLQVINDLLKVSEKLLHNKNSISDMVELTYIGLPNDLRQCFLYMGVFSKDYEISTWTLTRLWIAEGFIQPKDINGENLEETANQYLDTLICWKVMGENKDNFLYGRGK